MFCRWDRVRVDFFAEDRHQHTLAPVRLPSCPDDWTCRGSRAGSTRWKQRRLGVDIVRYLRPTRVLVLHETGQFLCAGRPILAAQAFRTSAADGLSSSASREMLDRDELVPLLPRFDKDHVQTDFQFLRDHFSFPPSRMPADADADEQTR